MEIFVGLKFKSVHSKDIWTVTEIYKKKILEENSEYGVHCETQDGTKENYFISITSIKSNLINKSWNLIT